MKKTSLFAFVLTLFLSFRAAASDDLYMYIWAEYIPNGVLKEFTKETGIKVHASTFDNLDDMYAKIKITNGRGYDLVMASIEYISLMKRQNMLEKLDKSALPELKNIDGQYLNLPYDPDNAYTVPFTLGTSTFAVNADKVDVSKLQKLEDLGRPEFKRRLILLNDMRAVLGMGLRMNGFSVNDKNEKHLQQAFETLKEKILPNVKAYDTEATVQALLNGEADIVMTWNGLAYAAMRENPHIVEVRFKEGTNFWIDSFAMLKNAQNKQNALKFLNFIMRPDIAKKIYKEHAYTSPSRAVRDALPPQVRDNKTLYPPASAYQDILFENDISEVLPLYEKYWLKLKSFHYE